MFWAVAYAVTVPEPSLRRLRALRVEVRVAQSAGPDSRTCDGTACGATLQSAASGGRFRPCPWRWLVSCESTTSCKQAFNPSGALARLCIQGLNVVGKGVSVMASGRFDDGAICTGRKDSCDGNNVVVYACALRVDTSCPRGSAHNCFLGTQRSHTSHNPCSSATAAFARIPPRRG